MNNYELPLDALPYKLKTARQKKRLQKEDSDKQLIQIIKKRAQYWKEKQNLPWIPLEIPYQRGWKRHFVLREDVKRSPMADFYESLLKRINTVQHSADRSFKTRRRRRRRKAKEEKKQILQEFPEWQWEQERYHGLTALEKAHFHLYEKWDKQRKNIQLYYRFNEPWRYVLKIVPHMITHVKMVDEILESKIQRLDNYICNYHLEPRIAKLKGGAYHYWKWESLDKPLYVESKKDALLQIKEAIIIKRQEKFYTP